MNESCTRGTSPRTETTLGDYAEEWSHVTPKYLIRRTADYIVFIDGENDIDWQTSKKYDASGHKAPAKHHAILNEAALLESTPCHGLGLDTILHFKRLIGEAYARSFEHDYTSATKMLEAAGNYILARSQETSRFWYLSSSLVATVPFMILGLAFWLWRDMATRMVGIGMLWLILSAVAGAMGALLSVIARTGKLRFDCSSGKRLHYMEGASRIWAGALSGIVVALAIRSEIFLAPLARGERMHTVMIIAALAAGAIERLATSIISAVAAKHADRQINKPNDTEDDDELGQPSLTATRIS